MANSTASATSSTPIANPTVVQTQGLEFFNPADDPLFVSHNENIGSSLVTAKLTDSDNYIPWRKAMSRTLGVKTKMEFVLGSVPRPVNDSLKLARWERCNNVILTWIKNTVSDEIVSSLVHSTSCIQAWIDLKIRFGGDYAMKEYSISREINLLMQGEMTVSTYFSKLLQLWGDEDSYEDDDLCDLAEKCKSTKCMHDKKTKTRIQKFLMGLNDIHANVRTQILATRPLPDLNEAYSLILSDESQKRISKPVVIKASALYSSYSKQSDRQNNSSSDRQFNNYNDRQSGFNKANGTNSTANTDRNRRTLQCIHCQLQGHLKETCYRLVGYPQGHKLYKGDTTSNYRNSKPAANNVSMMPHSTNSVDRSLPAGSEDSPTNQLAHMQEQLTKLFSLFSQQEKKR
ncbi:unnamed protein product [Rhodiola kirilowii]